MKNLKISIFLILIILLFNCSNVKAADLEPSIKGEAAIAIDIDTKEIIYTKNIDKQLYPASTTKLVTAMLLAKNKKASDLLTYSIAAKSEDPVKLDLPVGDKVTAADAMDSMLLDSDNDIAYMVGENLGGTIPKFADMMNAFISSLNLHNTHFVTPNGLPNINHYTTAYDLSVIGREALKYPWVASALNTKQDTFKTSKNITIKLKNTNKLLGIDGCIGGKTGYTDDAGRCLVAMYERNGRRIIGIVLKSEMNDNDTAVFDDMKKIINYSYEKEKTTVVKSNSTVKTLKITYNVVPFIGPSETIDVPLYAKNDIKYYSNDINSPKLTFNISTIDIWKLDTNTSVGEVSLSEREIAKKTALYPAISVKNVIAQNMGFYIDIAVFSLIVIIILRLYLYFKIRKIKRFRRNLFKRYRK